MEKNDKSSKTPLTAFSESESVIREQYKTAELKPAEFSRKLKACALSCRGMCCYGGVSVDESTAAVLNDLSKERAADFREMGLELPEQVVSRTEWHGMAGNITAVKPRAFRSLVPDFPAHFDETACVFLMEDARCGLQVLAQKDGKHPWYYKPFSCWLLPIKMYEGRIRLFDDKSDPFIFPDYDGFICRSHCGRTEAEGTPASTVLRAELGFLGDILGRNLVAEATSERMPKSQDAGD